MQVLQKGRSPLALSAKVGTVLSHLRPYRSQLIFATIVTAVMTLLSQMPPLLMRTLVDRVISPGDWHNFGYVVLAFALLPVLQGIGTFLSTFLLSYVGQRFVFDLRRHVYEHIAGLSERFFHKHPAGLLLNRIMSDTSFIQNMITGQTVQFVSDAVYAIFAIAMLMYLKLSLSTLVLVILPLYVLNHRYFKRRIKLRRRMWLAQVDQMSSYLQERISAAQTVRAYSREYVELENFIQHHTACHDLALISSRYTGVFTAMAQLITGWSMAAVYCAGCLLVLRKQMSYGDVVAFCSYASMLFTPMIRLSNMANTFVQADVSLDRLFELLGEEPEVRERPNPVRVPAIRGDVRFEGVWFAYEDDQYVLQDISFEVPAGASAALVGHTGCGKSTIAGLILRNYDPQQGRILIDGVDLRDLSLDEFRRQTAMVFQDSIVFHASLRDNIAYGRPDASEEEIRAAARVAEIDSFAAALPDGYETPVGEGGVILSVGEKQRLSIARAVLNNPRILILDEATSSVDPNAEAQIKRAMENVMRNRTTIVIAHRLTTIVKMDLILVLDHGRIVERGRHEELIARGGPYCRLFEEQMRLMPRI